MQYTSKQYTCWPSSNERTPECWTYAHFHAQISIRYHHMSSQVWPDVRGFEISEKKEWKYHIIAAQRLFRNTDRESGIYSETAFWRLARLFSGLFSGFRFFAASLQQIMKIWAEKLLLFNKRDIKRRLDKRETRDTFRGAPFRTLLLNLIKILVFAFMPPAYDWLEAESWWLPFFFSGRLLEAEGPADLPPLRVLLNEKLSAKAIIYSSMMQ